MVSADEVVGDASKVSDSLTKYGNSIGGLSDSWKGTSSDSIISKAESFVSEYQAINKQMENFANAVREYENYKNLKDKIKQTESDRNNASDENKASYDEPLQAMRKDLETYKSNIELYLSTASSPSLDASAIGGDVSSDKSDSQFKTSDGVAASQYAIEPHSLISDEEREKRIAMVGDVNGEIVTIDVPYWDGNSEKTMQVTVNAAIADEYKNVFRDLTDMHFPVKPEETGAYVEKYMPSGRISDHGYGTAIDINWDDNPMLAGDNPNSPETDPYVVTEQVVEAFARQGFYWGADWPQDEKDYMHFTFTGW